MKTVSLKLAKQLKEAGYPEEGSYAWYVERHYIGFFNGENPRIECIPADMFNKNLYQEISDTWVANAPTADEILDLLPEYIINPDTKGTYTLHFEKDTNDFYKAYYQSLAWNVHDPEFEDTFQDNTEEIDMVFANLLAKMWIYLKKEGLLESHNGHCSE